MSYDVMRQIVASGANLILEDAISYEVLRELVESATRSGSHITIDAAISYEMVREIAAIGKGQVTFLVKGKRA